MTEAEIIEKIRQVLPDAQVSLTDLTGTKDHWKITVISEAFRDKSLMQQHKLIHAALKEDFKGPLHALSIETKVPQ